MAAVKCVLALAPLLVLVLARPESTPCNVYARTDAGRVCGSKRLAADGAVYASFRGVPYAKQPLGELRFKELEPPEPWVGDYVATEEGPTCDQTDVVYGRIMQPRGSDEECIHANIHVPVDALPPDGDRPVGELQPPYRVVADGEGGKGLPILVMVHGGGFQGGSGDADLHGPEYLVSKNVIVITFNYRLNVFGFLSLNSPEIPGNQGLRDMVTLLRWVRRNARAFGGDPANVTLMGQSAGAAAVHLLTLSKATVGLYARAILMSGTAISGFYSTSPAFALQVSEIFLATLGINSTSLEDIHRQLVKLPVKKIHEANLILLDQFGLSTFVPTVERAFPGVTTVLDEDPEVLVAKGRGKDVPLIIGFTDVECEVFRGRLDQIDIGSRIVNNSVLTVPANIIFTTLPEFLPDIAKKIGQRYYNGTIDTDNFIQFCTDAFYKYPALKLAEKRADSSSEPVFLYQFSYNSDRSVLREALALDYKGAAHVEDLTYMFKVNSMLGPHNSFPPKERDDCMKDWMTNFVTNFMRCSEPVCENLSAWPPVQPKRLRYQDIHEPSVYRHRGLTKEHQDILRFFDSLRIQ